jgi:lipopolysaccharide export system protein LptA
MSRVKMALRAIAAAAMLAMPGAPLPAFAQGLGLNQDSDAPVEINADEGIEWRRDEQVYVARGKASAKRGEITVHADTLTAHYRPTDGGGTDIYRLDAVGHVVINSTNSKAEGDNAVYDVTNAIMVLKGHALRMTSDQYTVTARDSLEYWDSKQMAVARGDALVINQDKRLSGDVVTAFFNDASKKGKAGAKKAGAKTGTDGQNQIRRIEAFNNVRVSTPGQIALGDRGVYDVESGIASLYGSVKITREDNQLNGEYGEVDLNTGVSRMLSGPPGATGPKPVHGLFSPKKKPEITDKTGGPAEAGSVPGQAPVPPAAASQVPTQAPPPAP